MRLLRDVPGSVLWLLEGNDLADRISRPRRGARHRRRAHRLRAARLYDRHLARLGLADLFLDTLPVNAHTTASEALWCGVPVLTCMGTHFTSRVAASLLTAVGLPELITTSLADYEREALALARDPVRLGALAQASRDNRDTAPLFDTPRYVRNYEAALETHGRDAGGRVAPVWRRVRLLHPPTIDGRVPVHEPRNPSQSSTLRVLSTHRQCRCR